MIFNSSFETTRGSSIPLETHSLLFLHYPFVDTKTRVSLLARQMHWSGCVQVGNGCADSSMFAMTDFK